MWFDNLQIIRTIDDLVDSLNNVVTAPSSYPAAGADDGHYYSTAFLHSGYNYVNIGNAANHTVNGGYVRFANVQVPQGAQIASATVRLRACSSRSDSVSVRIRAVAADNPSAPGSATAIANAVKTTASADWSPAAWTEGEIYETPDIGAVIQEIIDREGWESGNAILIDIANNGTAYQNYRNFYAIEYADGAYKAELIIGYSE